jgi:hypothetical protein
MAKKAKRGPKAYKMPASVRRANKIIEKEVAKLAREEAHHSKQLTHVKNQLKALRKK